jgi:hypothetical protein
MPPRTCTCAEAPAVPAARKHLEDLPLRRRWRVSSAKADGDGASAETVFDAAANLDHFRVGRSARRRGAARKEVARILHDRHPHGNVADGDAVVDHLSRLAFAIPLIDVRGSDFELEHARHAVEHGVAIVFSILSVAVQVDEPGGDDQSLCVDAPLTLKRFRIDRDDPPAADADVPNAIDARFGINHAPVLDDKIEIVGRGRARDCPSEPHQDRQTFEASEVVHRRGLYAAQCGARPGKGRMLGRFHVMLAEATQEAKR